MAVDCRVIVAAKSDLRELADQGIFRADLFYRLNVAVLQIPPLRQRKDDIPLLMAHFLQQAAQRFHLPVPVFRPADVLRWQSYDWPGNVRELKNIAERLCLGLSDDLFIGAATGLEGDAMSLGLAAQVEQVERSIICNALKVTQGQVSQTADLLQIPRKTLYDKLARHGLRADAFRQPDPDS